MIGFRELFILLLFFGVPLAIGVLIWRGSRRAVSPSARLAELDSLRATGKITQAEYERQRAAILSRV